MHSGIVTLTEARRSAQSELYCQSKLLPCRVSAPSHFRSRPLPGYPAQISRMSGVPERNLVYLRVVQYVFRAAYPLLKCVIFELASASWGSQNINHATEVAYSTTTNIYTKKLPAVIVLSRKRYHSSNKIVPVNLRRPMPTALVVKLTHLPHDNARADETIKVYLRSRRRTTVVTPISWGSRRFGDKFR
jgi:hypothetical protein